jgi:ABC-type multidrug transport system fused ATPase/permease subunit
MYTQVCDSDNATVCELINGGQIVFDDVHFAYAPDKPAVLKGITFTVEPGHTIALVMGEKVI